jgi:hypothetical protein
MDEELAHELIEYINRTLDREAEQHYSNFIFKAEVMGDSPYLKYRRNWGQYETDLIERIQKLVLTQESD